MTNMETKIALKACNRFEDFDDILSQTWCKTDADKIEYLKQLFDIYIDYHGHDDVHGDYVRLVEHILANF